MRLCEFEEMLLIGVVSLRFPFPELRIREKRDLSVAGRRGRVDHLNDRVEKAIFGLHDRLHDLIFLFDLVLKHLSQTSEGLRGQPGFAGRREPFVVRCSWLPPW